MFDKRKRKIYEIELPNNKKIKIWFIGKQLEILLNEYKIPYKIIRKNNV